MNSTEADLWKAIIQLSRDLTQMHRLLIEAYAVLEGHLGVDLIPRSRDRPQEQPKRHLRLVSVNGRVMNIENDNEEKEHMT